MSTTTDGPAAGASRTGASHGAGLWLWAGLLTAALVTAGLGLVADWLVMFGHSSTCYDPPDPDEVRSGRIALTLVLAVSALPWALGTLMARRRVVVAVCGLVAVAPAFVLFLNGLRTGAWVGGFCF
jgi:hypothetical protein